MTASFGIGMFFYSMGALLIGAIIAYKIINKVAIIFLVIIITYSSSSIQSDLSSKKELNKSFNSLIYC